MTRLCVPIFVESAEQAARDIALAAESGADWVELRVDTFLDAAAIVKDSLLPCLVTCRPVGEGGLSEMTDAARVAALELAAAAGAAYLDLELSTLPAAGPIIDLPRDSRPGLVVSAHDFKGRPDRLYNLLAEMNAADAEVTKIVWAARSVRDNLEAFELLVNKTKPTIALCMGEAGLISRVLAKKFGAFLTFAPLRDAAATAPGQVSIGDLKRLYRWDAITPATKVYGVVASPVAHSMSPAVHNAAFAAAGHDGVYLPLLVQPGYESFKAFMETFLAFGPLDLAGLSITLPHKENALRYLTEKGAAVEPLAARIGAVNTIHVRPDGSLAGSNTDFAAILACVRMGLKSDDLTGRRVAVIGAGGTGRTAVAALADAGAAVSIFNRTRARADALAEEFDGKSGPVSAFESDALADLAFDVYVNTTSVGMSPNADKTPFDASALPPGAVVFDTVYNPMRTKLLQQADAAGARTVGGVEMFVRQAAAQFSTWTGLPPPLDVMRAAVESRLGG